MTDRNGDGVLDDPHNQPARFALLTQKGQTALERGAAVIRDELKKIGLVVDVVPLEGNALVQRFLSGQPYDAIYFQFGMTNPDPALSLDFWLSSGDSRVWNLAQKVAGDRLGATDRRVDGEADYGDRGGGAQAAVRSGATRVRGASAGRAFRRAQDLRGGFEPHHEPHARAHAPAVPVGGGDDRREAVAGRMLSYLLRRLLFAAFLVFAVSSASLVVTRLAPGDYATGALGLGASQEARAQMRARFGLDRPLAAQVPGTGWAAPCASTSAARSPTTVRSSI